MLVSAAFWAFLWGPIGLVLSSPLTVCLVVLGRYIPQLEFLSVLLGDEPALDAAISFYQRLLARDQDEAESLVIEQMKAAESPEQVYDTMLLPALGAIKRNRLTGDITEEDEQYALQAIREIVEDIGEGRIGAAGRRRPGRGRGAARGPGPGRAADPDLRLPGPRRRGPGGPGDAPARPRPGPVGPRADRAGDPDRRAARPGGRAAAGRGLHRGHAARRPGAHPIPVQAAAVAVPRPEDPRGPLGGPGHHDDRPGPRGRRRSGGHGPQGGGRRRVAAAPKEAVSDPMVAAPQGGRRRPGGRHAAGDPPAARQPDPGPGAGPRRPRADGAAANGASGRGRGPAAPRTGRWRPAPGHLKLVDPARPPPVAPRAGGPTIPQEATPRFHTCVRSSRSSRRA